MKHRQSDYMYWAKTRAPVRYNLGSSEVPHFPLDRFGIAVESLEIDGASRYRYPPLREAIAAKCGVASERVVMADGASMANMLALAALIEPGDEVLIETPGYEPITAAALFCGAQVRHVARAEPDLRLDPGAVAAAMTPATRLIVLTNLHNPSSARTGQEALLALAVTAGQLGARILIDEIFLDAAVPPQPTAHLLSDTFVCTGSLTKVYGLSGLRCGWILAEPDLAERMWRLNELFAVAQAHATERLALIALDRLADIAAGNDERLARNRDLLNGWLAAQDRLACAPLTEGITAFPRLLDGDPQELDTLLRERFDTAIVPGIFFGAPDRFRLGIGGPTDRLEAALDRLSQALRLLP